MQRGPNIIIHPTRRNGIGSTKSFFGRVMMSVRYAAAALRMQLIAPTTTKSHGVL